MNRYFKINGGNELSGNLRINGAKNSALPLMIATLIANDKFVLTDIPHIKDVSIISSILERLGSDVYYEDEGKSRLVIDNTNLDYKDLMYEDVSRLRASYYFAGALLGKYGKAKILLPGGCFLGERPIDLHIKGFEALGCEVVEGRDGNFDVLELTAKGGKLVPGTIFLDFPSVGATINILLAAAQIEGETVIENAAKEPEIVDVVMLLNQMGAQIKGAGTDVIKIKGVRKFRGCNHTVIPDRIEAGTYIMFGALLGNDLVIDNIIPEHLEALFSKLKETGVDFDVSVDSVRLNGADTSKLKPISVRTGVHPSFPTDLQQIMTTLLTQITGKSEVEDTIYPERFRNCEYLNKMGASIEVETNADIGRAEILGGGALKGKEVIATDLRAGAGLILAGLLAEGETQIYDINHILRGYDDIVAKMQAIGADIELIEEEVI